MFILITGDEEAQAADLPIQIRGKGMTREIKITSSKGNSANGHQIFWAWVDGKMLRKSNGVGRTFHSERAARQAAEKHPA